MKLIVDDRIPFIAPELDRIGGVEAVYLSPDEITRDAAMEADGMIVRTRTRCNAALLEGTPVKFVATATIGFDHIDVDYCRSRGITVANAPGCNAPAVAQWVFAAIAALRPDVHVLGVIGEGHVGSIVSRWGRSMGMEVLVSDPPRQLAGEPGVYTSVDEIARRADAITFHTPLTTAGPHATWHLANAALLAKLERKPLFLNASRGPVVDTPALVDAIDRGLVGVAAIDCWEGEPVIDRGLLDRAVIATQHIAGYSLQGKMRATFMVVSALRRFLGLEPGDEAERVMPVPADMTLERAAASYDIMADTRVLKASPGDFETLRDDYPLRNEAR